MVEPKDDAVRLLAEYGRLYAEHWTVTRSAPSLMTPRQQNETNERPRALRGRTLRILPDVKRHLSEVGIDISEVSGGVRPEVVDRVIALAIDRHRHRAALLAQGRVAPSESRQRVTGLAVLGALLVLVAIGWGAVDGWLIRLIDRTF